MLPSLLRNIHVLKPGVTKSGFSSGETHDELFTSIVGRAITMRTPHSVPWVIGVIAGAYSGIKITKYDVQVFRGNCC